MVYEHEIPTGGKLYFGETAKFKREFEAVASRYFYDNGFEEIVTPFFSYQVHQSIEDENSLIRLSDADNKLVVLRADSSLDVVRLIAKRLGRTTSHTKWFYCQPVFRHPTTEMYQIGAEIIGSKDVATVAKHSLSIVNSVKQFPMLELSNSAIVRAVIDELQCDESLIRFGQVAKLHSMKKEWLDAIIGLHDLSQCEEVAKLCPDKIGQEVIKLGKLALEIGYDKTVLFPLYCSSMTYYENEVFRLVDGNRVIATGGSYKSEADDAVGFAIHTDELIENFGKGC